MNPQNLTFPCQEGRAVSFSITTWVWGVWGRDVACNVRTEVWEQREDYFREILTNSH